MFQYVDEYVRRKVNLNSAHPASWNWRNARSAWWSVHDGTVLDAETGFCAISGRKSEFPRLVNT